jgi:hypothetical protein
MCYIFTYKAKIYTEKAHLSNNVSMPAADYNMDCSMHNGTYKVSQEEWKHQKCNKIHMT